MTINPPTPLLSEFLTEAETAEQLGISLRTIIRWRVLKQGPNHTKVGRKIIYRRSTVATWLQRQEVAS